MPWAGVGRPPGGQSRTLYSTENVFCSAQLAHWLRQASDGPGVPGLSWMHPPCFSTGKPVLRAKLWVMRHAGHALVRGPRNEKSVVWNGLLFFLLAATERAYMAWTTP